MNKHIIHVEFHRPPFPGASLSHPDGTPISNEERLAVLNHPRVMEFFTKFSDQWYAWFMNKPELESIMDDYAALNKNWFKDHKWSSVKPFDIEIEV